MSWFEKRGFSFATIAVVFVCLTIIARPLYIKTPLSHLEQKQLPQSRRLHGMSQGRSQRLPAEIIENSISKLSNTITASSDTSFWGNLLDSSIGWESSSSDQSWQEILNEDHSRVVGDNVVTKSHTHFLLVNHSSVKNACPERKPFSGSVLTDDGPRLGSGIPTELYNLAPEVFDSVPSKFIKDVRIPCWRTTTKKVLCLPSFFLAGLPKAGSTDLWAKIMAHPDVIRVGKEPHWWTRERIEIWNGNTGISEYARHFKDAAHAIQKRPKLSRKLVVGDGSASTFWDNHLWYRYFPMEVCKDGPPYIIADVIRHVLPKSKIVVIFRNPTDRLYSDYIYFGSKKRRTEFTFHDDVTDTINKFDRCAAKRSRRACAYSTGYNSNDRPKVRLHIGLYSIFARDWLKSFPRDQLMFLRLDDWHVRCSTLLPQVYDFLNLEPQTEQRISISCSQKLQNPTKKTSGKMLDQTRRILDDFYASTRRELADLLHDDGYLWQ